MRHTGHIAISSSVRVAYLAPNRDLTLSIALLASVTCWVTISLALVTFSLGAICYTSIGSVSVKAHYQPLEAG